MANANINGIFANIFVKTLCQYLCQYLWGSAATLVCLLVDYYLAAGAIFRATFPLSKKRPFFFFISFRMSILQLLSFISNNVFSTHAFLTAIFFSILHSSFNYGLPSVHFTSKLGLSQVNQVETWDIHIHGNMVVDVPHSCRD